MSVNRYHLYVRIEGKWQWVSTIDARNHSEAFQGAMLALNPHHFDKPIRLEQEDSPGVHTPPDSKS